MGMAFERLNLSSQVLDASGQNFKAFQKVSSSSDLTVDVT
jgi:hypothetical protein